MKTTREHFGAILASLARLYNAAERRGDTHLAARYAEAVDVLLGACPPDAERSAAGAPEAPSWPEYEQTLIGLGIVPRAPWITSAESVSGVRSS